MSLPVNFLVVAMAFSQLAPYSAGVDERVLHVSSSPVEMPLAVPLPQDMVLDVAAPWELVEVGTDVSVPAQLGAFASADGTPDESRQRLLAIIPPVVGNGGPRRFRLRAAESAAPTRFEFADLSPQSLELREGPQPVLVYNHGLITREDIPEQEHRRSRACYIHPVYGLSGEVLTDDFSADHYHHHGVFWTWPHVMVEQTAHDLWAGNTIRQQFIRWLARETGPVAAVLAVENGWYVGDELVMIERIWMRTYRASENDRAVELEMSFTPLRIITLQGAEEKSYGGLTVRFAPGARDETLITVPSGPTTEDLPDTPLAWADFTSRFGQLEHRSGAAIFVPPHHPDFPPTWLTRYYGPLCVGWPGVHARSFEPGTPFQLEYRLWLHRQPAELTELQEVYAAYGRVHAAMWNGE